MATSLLLLVCGGLLVLVLCKKREADAWEISFDDLELKELLGTGKVLRREANKESSSIIYA